MGAHRRRPPSSTPAHVHTPGTPCPHCGQAPDVERSYAINDRMLQMLLLALCKTHKVTATRKTKTSSRIYVTAPDDAMLDHLEARFQDLMPRLDAALVEVTTAFLRVHTGVELTAPTPTP